MSEFISVKLRKVGTSLGILIPKEMLSKEHLKEGSVVEFTLIKRQRQLLIKKYLGIAKGATGFKREYEGSRF